MKLELRDPRPPVCAAALAEAERKLAEWGRSIPDSYKELLADQDGGRPLRDLYEFVEDGRPTGSRVKVFLGVGPDPDGDLVRTAGLNLDLPDGLLAVAPDGLGNKLCLREDGSVVFWEHEEEGISEVAPDFSTFLASLYEDPEPLQVNPRRLRRFLALVSVSFELRGGPLDPEPRATLADGVVFGVTEAAPPHDAELEPLLTVAWREVSPDATLAVAVADDLASALAEPGSVLVDREPVELAGVGAVRTFALHRAPGGRPTAAEQWRLLAGGRCWTVSALSAVADQPAWGPWLAAAAATLRIE